MAAGHTKDVAFSMTEPTVWDSELISGQTFFPN